MLQHVKIGGLTRHRGVRLASLAAAAVFAAAVGGCSVGVARVAVDEHRMLAGSGLGDSSGAVFLPPRVERLDGEYVASDQPEYWRNDGAMAIAGNGVLTATSQWPVAERASLERPRYIFLPTSGNTQVYYLPWDSYRTDGRDWRSRR